MIILALKALGYFLVATIIALFLGLLAGNLVSPGSVFQGQPSQAQLLDQLMNFFEKNKDSIAAAGPGGAGPGGGPPAN